MFSIVSHWSATIGTTEALITSIPAWKSDCLVWIFPDSTNAGIVYVGNTGLTAWTTAATDWVPILANSNPLPLPIGNPPSIYGRASQASQKVFFIVGYMG